MKNGGLLKEIMTTDLEVVQLNTPFETVKSLFENNSFHHLPVVDETSMIKGIISKQDFTKLNYQLTLESGGKIYYTQQWYDQLKAKDVMTKNPVFLNPDDTIGLAADLFLENAYHAIPIMEDGVLVGIVTTHDLLAYAFYRDPVGGE